MFATTPSSLCRCRTTLVPKAGGDLHKVDNWRPITISPIAIRIFHCILVDRLSSINTHQHSVVFKSLDGTLANVLILQTIIKNHRKAVNLTK